MWQFATFHFTSCNKEIFTYYFILMMKASEHSSFLMCCAVYTKLMIMR